MDRSWVYRVITYSLLTLVAFVVLTPTLATWLGKEDQLPRVDAQAPAEEDHARSRSAGRPAPRLRGPGRQGGQRQGRPSRRVTSKSASTRQAHQGSQGRPQRPRRDRADVQGSGRGQEARPRVLEGLRRNLYEESRDPATGVVKLRMDQDYIEEQRDYGGASGRRDHPQPRRQARRLRADDHPQGQRHHRRAARPQAGRLRARQEADRPHRPARVQDGGRRLGVHEEGRRPRAGEEGRVPRHRDRPRRLDREGLGAAALGRLPARQGQGRAREVLRVAHRRRRGPARSRDRLRAERDQGRGRQLDLDRQALAHLLSTPPRRAHRRAHHGSRGHLGSADRPPRSLAHLRPRGREPLREGDRRQHRPQDGHHPRREDQLGAGHRRAHRRRPRAHHDGRLLRSLPAPGRGQGPRRRLEGGRAAGAAQADARDAGRPDARQGRRRQGQVLDDCRLAARHLLHAHLLPRVGPHRRHRDGAQHRLPARGPRRARRDLDACPASPASS